MVIYTIMLALNELFLDKLFSWIYILARSMGSRVATERRYEELRVANEALEKKSMARLDNISKNLDILKEQSDIDHEMALRAESESKKAKEELEITKQEVKRGREEADRIQVEMKKVYEDLENAQAQAEHYRKQAIDTQTELESARKELEEMKAQSER
ncbi:hypothetical protein [Thioalkalivibrio sp. HK1]|uniref:hypothetical protein n=1 Tax=Thioalkalivibrio sp. HK1 TaxID=1469245 RepID=UPI0012DCA1A3|nr:hypothetical protein [Thioalkalivibrio sp. HK1]